MVEMKGANTRIMMAVRLRGILTVLDPCRRGKGGLTRGEKKNNFVGKKEGTEGRGGTNLLAGREFVRDKKKERGNE